MKNVKIVWVNILKYLGMLAIYIGHFNVQAGMLYKFVFFYHVPLFFFVSGFFDDIHDLKFKQYLKKIFLKLMVPYFVMEVIFLLILIITSNLSVKDILIKILYIILGLKDKLPANSLWFIPCLFSIKILNYIVLKVSKKMHLVKIFPIVFAVFIYIFLRYFLFYKLGLNDGPKLFWSIDGICWYYIYFILGKNMFVHICKLFDKKKKGVIFYALFIFVTVFTIISYYNYVDCYSLKILPIISICLVLKALLIILFNCYIAYFLSKIIFISNILNDIGSNTLYLCGTEQLIKYIFNGMIYVLFGVSIVFSKPIYVVGYTIFLLVIDNYFVIPYVKKISDFFSKKISNALSKIVCLKNEI